MAGLAELLQKLTALGVNAKLRLPHPPTALNAADLPALWVQLPSADDAPISFQHAAHWPRLVCDVVVAVAPVAAATAANNFAALVAAMDELNAALRSARLTSWTIRAAVMEVADTAYWCVVGRIEKRGDSDNE